MHHATYSIRRQRSHYVPKHYFDTVPKFIECVEPPFIVVENVVGVAANNNSNRIDGAVEKLIQALSKLKYQISQCNLDAADYGVPQRRKRCIIIGAKAGYRLQTVVCEAIYAINQHND